MECGEISPRISNVTIWATETWWISRGWKRKPGRWWNLQRIMENPGESCLSSTCKWGVWECLRISEHLWNSQHGRVEFNRIMSKSLGMQKEKEKEKEKEKSKKKNEKKWKKFPRISTKSEPSAVEWNLIKEYAVRGSRSPIESQLSESNEMEWNLRRIRVRWP